MPPRSVKESPQLYARTGGVLYLALIGLGVVGEAVRDNLVVSGNSAATAANLVSMEFLWRVGIAAEILGLICATALAAIYFVLLNPVGRELNLMATFLRLVAISIQVFAVTILVMALFPLGNAAYLSALALEQRHALMSLAIRSHAYVYGTALLFFGFTFLIHGYLIFKSGFLPRLIGILIQIAGVCYSANSLALLLAPAFQDRIFPFILLPSFIGESTLALWLVIKGVDVAKWRDSEAKSVRYAAVQIASQPESPGKE